MSIKSTEKATWTLLRPYLSAALLDPVRIENRVGIGMPDVNITHGWIELKYMEKWPVRGGPLRLDHYTKEQKVWGQRRWYHNGGCWLLLRCADDWFLFDSWTAAKAVGSLNRWDLREAAATWHEGPIVGWAPSLLRWLKSDREGFHPHEWAHYMRLRCMKTRQEVATDLGWNVDRVRHAEWGQVERDVQLLIDYWEN